MIVAQEQAVYDCNRNAHRHHPHTCGFLRALDLYGKEKPAC